jgi:hypothetical protein
MTCPYCGIRMKPDPSGGPFGHGSQMFYSDAEREQHRVSAVACPDCHGIFLLHNDFTVTDGREDGTSQFIEGNEFILLPRVSSRPGLSSDVPEPYASLYEEAALILSDSPRASAALSRRCLQHLLREEAKAPPSDLYKEIEWTMANAGLPGYATASLHDLREIGNMAAHPNKSTATGEYLEVEPGEAEWTLDTLDVLFRFYFIDPAILAARKADLAARTGKP